MKEAIKYLLALGMLLFIKNVSFAQESKTGDPELQSVQQPVAPVKIDGNLLFNVRGISTYTPEQRAAAISKRIKTAASESTILTDSVKIVASADYYSIYAGNIFIMNVYSADADNEKIRIETLSQIIKQKTVDAIVLFRHNRSTPYLIRKSITALGSIILFVLILLMIIWLFRRIDVLIQKKMKSSIDSLENKSFSLIRAHQLWKVYHGAVKLLRIIMILILVVFAVNYLLGLFPWTNNVAIFSLNLITDPVLSIGKGLLNFLPNLAFLIVIYFVTRYLLKLSKVLFNGLKKGEIRIKEFDPDWAMPTFKIFRIFVIAFAVILSYPYIPGSESSAFKGISVFMGVLFSLGSSSFISNIIAGYTITYRRAFKIGDRIKVEGQEGFVEEQKVLVTRLRSIKNEEIVIPNSLLLNSNIINYSAKARESGLIIHAEVGIGYETPWRQVEAMLLEAADRTECLLKKPAPFVLQLSLGDFAIQYQINGYCSDGSKLELYYTDLHKNILDVFNENNIQIMTPAYMGDPAVPKVVPEKMWDLPLAKKK